MHTSAISSLLLLAVALPVAAQIRQPSIRADLETRRPPGTRVLELTRAPRAVLGIMTAPDDGRSDTLGVRVAEVTEGGPAERAGIRAGNRIQAVDGVNLRVSAADADDPMLSGLANRRLTRALSDRKPGDEVELRVADGNQARNVRVRLADPDSLRRSRVATRAVTGSGGFRTSMANRASLGIQIGSTGSRRDTLGVLVMGADDEGPAARAGIIEGTRIAAINGADLRVGAPDVEDGMVATARVQRLHRALADVKPGDEVSLRVWQNGQYRDLRVRTVSSDSLRGRRSTYIIGERFDAMPRVRMIPRGGEMGPFRFEMTPRFNEEINGIVGEALRSARTALDGARGAVYTLEGRRVYH